MLCFWMVPFGSVYTHIEVAKYRRGVNNIMVQAPDGPQRQTQEDLC